MNITEEKYEKLSKKLKNLEYAITYGHNICSVCKKNEICDFENGCKGFIFDDEAFQTIFLLNDLPERIEL